VKKIIFDARLISGDYSGIARYTYSLLSGLLEQVKLYDRLLILLDKNENYQFNGHYQNLTLKLNEKSSLVLIDAPLFSLKHHLNVSRFVNKSGTCLYFYPHFDLPCFIRNKSVFVVHDLLPYIVPNYFVKWAWMKKQYVQITMHKALKRHNSTCITVSKSTRKELLKSFGDKFHSKTNLVYETAPLSTESLSIEPINSSQKKGKIVTRSNYLLYVGNRRPHKNLEWLITVFRRLKSEFNYSGKLLIVGEKKNWKTNIEKLVSDDTNIQIVNQVSDHELKQLYGRMDALFYPSLHEGFGLPIVEAASHGKPIITSDRSATKEIAPPWALLINPEDEHYDQVAKKIANYLEESLIIEPKNYSFLQLTWQEIARDIFEPALLNE